MANMIWMEGITQTFHLEGMDLPVLKKIDLSINDGEYVAIMGASGSGKSTLEIMNLLTELNQQGTTIIVVTHDASVAAQTKRTIHMVDGKIVEAANVGIQAAGSNLVNASIG